jgi:hypothetical protein
VRRIEEKRGGERKAQQRKRKGSEGEGRGEKCSLHWGQ